MKGITLGEAALTIERKLNESINQPKSNGGLNYPLNRASHIHLNEPVRLMNIGYEDGSGTSFIFEIVGEKGTRHVYLRDGQPFQPTSNA